MTKKVTITDIAEQAGVSRSTVSRVLSGSRRVSPSAAQAVERVTKAMSYRPSVVARSLARGVFPSIQLVIPDIRNPVYADVARGVQDIASTAGYMVDFTNTDDSPERELEYLATMKAQRFAGVILVAAAGGKELRRTLESWPSPVVLLSRRVKGLRTDSVLLDDEYGASMAVNHLVALGHKRIWHLAGLRRSSASTGRAIGFRQAMKEAALELPLTAIEFGDLRAESGERFGHRIVEAGIPCTAIFAANDLMAIGLLTAFSEHGVRVPDVVSLIGFDDMPFSRLPGVWLTTVRQPHYQMAQTAARMLLERIQDANLPARTVVFTPELIERKTCGPPRE